MKLDPRVNVSQDDLEKQFKLLSEVREQFNRVYDAVNQIQDVRDQLERTQEAAGTGRSYKSLLETAGMLDAKLISVRDPLVNLKISANEDSLTYPPGLDGRLAFLAMSVNGASDSAPTESQYQLFDRLKKQTEEFLATLGSGAQYRHRRISKARVRSGSACVQVPDGKSERVQGAAKADCGRRLGDSTRCWRPRAAW